MLRTLMNSASQESQRSAVADIVELLAFHGRRGADTLFGKVVFMSGLQFGCHSLPEKFAVSFPESHAHALIALDFRLLWIPVVGAEKYFSIGHQRIPIGGRTDLLLPMVSQQMLCENGKIKKDPAN